MKIILLPAFLTTFSVSILSALTLMGCDSSSARPSDFAVTYEYREGSLPPPYHNEYTVTVGPGLEGKIVYRPDYPGDKTPTWTETFPVTEAQLGEIYNLVRDKNLARDNWREQDNPPTGGSTNWAIITSGGKSFKIPVHLFNSDFKTVHELYTKMDSVVPTSVREKLEGQRERYVEEHTP